MPSDETRENAPESSIVELIDEFLMEEGLVSESPMEEEDPFNESLMEEFINEFLMEEGLIESPMEEDLTNESVIEEDLINESYWPRLREILVEDPSGMDRLGLECMICTMPMVINPHDLGQEDRVAYRIRVKHLIWGEFEGDERASHEVKLPFSMLQHCRNMESSLITTCSAPGLHLRVGDVKVGLFLYDEPMEHGRVVRRGLRNTALDTGSTVEIHY
ncbi:hypothetical protein CEP52_014698 [Fusarium oligoseptatum]|uniref:Uncharacterized protein n=1 Tax=Fusarium oligoseptatum TaxID=2604345 RepID=A0A428SK16_9HYPO|nr:hypothetical protein CEP52_014698 [Fusarium oligoseptatum]